jgi:hypothetical protein
MHRVACILCLSFLATSSAGCGKQVDTGKALEHGEQPAASASGKAQEPRLESGQSAPASPPRKDDQPAAQPGAAGPATLEEVLKVVDLRQMARPDNAKVKIASAAQLFYSVPGTLADTAAFCKRKLAELNWTEDSVAVPGLDPNKYVFAGFDKAGFHIALSVSKSTKEGLIDVNLTNYGNVDPRRLPRPADAKATFDYWYYVSYATAAKPAEVIELCRKELSAKGWQEYAVGSAKFFAKEGRFLAGFVSGAIDLSLNVATGPDGKTIVEYRTTIRDKPSPSQTAAMPPAATYSEGMKVIDLNRFPRLSNAEAGRGSSADLYYEAPGDVPGALRFYQEKLQVEGWTEEARQTVDEIEDFVTTGFDKDGFHLNLQINKGDKPNRVRIHLEHKGNVDVRRFPRLADAARGGLESFDDVDYETETEPEAAVTFYRKELAQRGWKEDKSESKEYPGGTKTLVFDQHAMLVKLRIDKGSVRIQSELIGAAIPRPASAADALAAIDLRQLPRMEGAVGARVDSAGLEYSVAGTIEDVLQFYRNEFGKKGWAEKSPAPPHSDNQAGVRFAKGQFIVELSARSKGDKDTTVSMLNRGDLDLRKLLHPPDVKVDFLTEPEEVNFTTGLSPEAAKDFYRRELPKFGWRDTSSASSQALEFSQNATKVMVSAGTSADGKATVQLRTWIDGMKQRD